MIYKISAKIEEEGQEIKIPVNPEILIKIMEISKKTKRSKADIEKEIIGHILKNNCPQIGRSVRLYLEKHYPEEALVGFA
jgi:hypothetical protein